MAYRIMTDSCCDLGKQRLAELNVSMASLGVRRGEDYYLDGELDIKAFYDGMRAGEQSTTSAVNPEGWARIMEPVLKAGEDVLVLAFSSGLSTAYQSAVIAAQELGEQYPQRKLQVIDTLGASAGQGLMVWYAAKLRDEGKSMEEVAQWVLENRLHVAHWFTVEDLKYLKRGGRISAATAVVGSMLSIKPIMHMDNEGKLVSVDKCRGRKASLTELANRLGETGLPGMNDTIFISQADCPDAAQYIADIVKTQWGVKEVVICDIGPVIGSHTGPGCISIFFLAQQR